MSGDVITRTLNEAFGFDGWCLEVKSTTREFLWIICSSLDCVPLNLQEPSKDEKGRYHVAYIATVRITHRRSGVYREDCGAGDAIDKSLGSASGNALKGAITDAMKRAARHFGEKLGNSLYHDGFNINQAPVTLKNALETLDIDRAKTRFGFEKDRVVPNGGGCGGVVQQHQGVCVAAGVKQEVNAMPNNSSYGGGTNPTKPNNPTNSCEMQQQAQLSVPNNNNNHPQATTAPAPYASQSKPITTPQNNYTAQKTPRHHVAATVNNQNNGSNNCTTNQQKVNPASSSVYVTPHHATNSNTSTRKSVDSNTTEFLSTFAAAPDNCRTASTTSNNTATSTVNGATVNKENANPQQTEVTTGGGGRGLNLPPRPGTSRGHSLPVGATHPISSLNTTNASDANSGTPSMFSSLALGGTQQSSQNVYQQPQGEGLKRKIEAAGDGGVAKMANTNAGVKNPYNALNC
ncbi:predicted protein [Thalassiosira pseudonana CCMP1335]|uniref:Uncharacterized protein n=1 Tax=Thalassiosira pseudonana TaxID=35128 RepID=B8LCY5_THAPS|nr:predicted protein [Thalassiosira pseudonana CCMP1335]EED86713.1 predicted protein [Thalassiosira pseudonana CCMP1335]